MLNVAKGDLVPDPPVFRIRAAQFAVPPFFPHNHPDTQWIINMIEHEKWDRLQRMATFNPTYFRTTYFQIPDRPTDNRPMFHIGTVLYLNPLGLALYLKKPRVVRLMCEFRDRNQELLVNANDLLYAANVYERHSSRCDLMVMYAFCVAIRREVFEAVQPLLMAGWQPHVNIILPYRKPYRCFSFHYRDFLDYALAQLWTRASIRITSLMKSLFHSYHDNFNPLSYEKVRSTYRNTTIEDWLSFPRRLLRFAYYYDLNLRVATGVVMTINVFRTERFFVAPTRSCWDINMAERFNTIPPHGGNPAERNKKIVFDQDNVIALFLALIHRATLINSYQAKDRAVDILIKILADTKWLLLFLLRKPFTLADYFQNLIEDVEIDEITVLCVVDHIVPTIQSGQLDDFALDDVNIPGGIKRGDWKQALQTFIDQYGEK